MEQATKEVSGKSRKGFRTTFLCSAGDQVDIARYFGEPVVLVPRAGLRPGADPRSPPDTPDLPVRRLPVVDHSGLLALGPGQGGHPRQQPLSL